MVEMLLSEFEKDCKDIESKINSLGLENKSRDDVEHKMYYNALQVIKKQAKINNPSEDYKK